MYNIIYIQDMRFSVYNSQYESTFQKVLIKISAFVCSLSNTIIVSAYIIAGKTCTGNESTALHHFLGCLYLYYLCYFLYKSCFKPFINFMGARLVPSM